MLIGLTLAWIIFAAAFICTLYVEARQTSWDLLEALIAANLLGHVVAYPVSKTIADTGCYFGGELEFQIVIVALLATVTSACMAGGGVWVFRRMKMLGESRRSVRIFYMLLGLLLFPSMVIVPYNLFFGWVIWGPLLVLNKDANLAVAARKAAEARTLQQTDSTQKRFAVAWGNSTAKQNR